MRASQFAVALLFISFVSLGCAERDSHVSGPAASSLAEQNELYTSWAHSSEEDQGDGAQVYRPVSSRDFPASRFRQVYQFSQDRTGARLVLDPADAHHMESMTWSTDRTHPNRVHLTDASGNALSSFEILELTPDLMRIRIVP